MKLKSVTRPAKSKDPLEESIKRGMPVGVPKKPESFDYDSEFDDKPSSLTRKRTLDPLSEQLGQTNYMYKARFGWLKQMVCGKPYPLEIERYYEGLKLAIDINIDKTEQKLCALKRDLCEANGVQYFYLSCPEDLEAMVKNLRTH